MALDLQHVRSKIIYLIAPSKRQLTYCLLDQHWVQNWQKGQEYCCHLLCYMVIYYLFIRLCWKQTVIQFFILAPPQMLRDLCRRSTQFTIASSLKIAIGTYNVNGGKHFRSVVYKDVSLSDWLLDSYNIAQEKSESNISLKYFILFFILYFQR